jgi:hypothetical protein
MCTHSNSILNMLNLFCVKYECFIVIIYCHWITWHCDAGVCYCSSLSRLEILISSSIFLMLLWCWLRVILVSGAVLELWKVFTHSATSDFCPLLDVYDKNCPCNRPWRPLGLWDIEVPKFFLDNRLTDGCKVVSLMRRPPFIPTKIPGTHFCYRLIRPQGHSAAGKIRSTEKSKDLIGNLTRDLPACGIVSQPTTPPRAP